MENGRENTLLPNRLNNRKPREKGGYKRSFKLAGEQQIYEIHFGRKAFASSNALRCSDKRAFAEAENLCTMSQTELLVPCFFFLLWNMAQQNVS